MQGRGDEVVAQSRHDENRICSRRIYLDLMTSYALVSPCLSILSPSLP